MTSGDRIPPTSISGIDGAARRIASAWGRK